MKICVIGGNKGTGAHVIRIAAAAGNEVTCLSRSGAADLPEGVRSISGDALSPDVLRAAIVDSDAVVVTVGGASGSARHRTQVTESVIAAMQGAGIRRLIVHSSLGVGDSLELIPRGARLLVRTVLGRALADHTDQEAAVERSGLDWTIVRPGGLTDAPASGDYLVQETAEGRPMKSRIARADVAAHIVKILDDPATFGRALSMGTA